ncbi:hypothetical protein B0T10DRAFT_540049 [Thelonectria olida]|uniref:Zn(2)-C6 fungal-type domain-containing protein n=1 Tax=Thelonectria olida TaxID=1576542 RepID=A0A9P8VXF5_9HYPO|nr:hypothetical protein B0T10DRAFT_540049 [Thelonectria olida]
MAAPFTSSRIRRVKCDETKPQCKKCTSSKRVCDGYLSEKNIMTRRELVEVVRGLNVVGPVSRALTQSPSSSNPHSRPVSPNDTVYFNLFRHVTVPSTCDIFPSSFWQENVMQMAHIEPAVWHATIALGTLHQRANALTLNKMNDGMALTRRAVAHYGKAMALARDLDCPTKVVTLSIMLVAAANMLERWSEMQTHVMAGLRIATQDAPRLLTLEALRGSLMRLDLQAMTFSDSTSPYPYEESSSIYAVDQFLMTPCVQGVSYEEMSSELLGISRAFFLLDDGLLSGNVTHGPWLTKFDSFLRRLALWESRMASFEIAHESTDSDQTTVLSLRLYHVTLRTMIRAASFGPETRYDELLGYFEHIVRLAATLQARMSTGGALSLSLEPGLIIPLWVTIHRCRHYRLRHAALKILADSNRVEGMWRSDAAAAMMETLVAVEEESLGPVNVDIYTPVLLDPFIPVHWTAWSNPAFCPPTTLDWSHVPTIPDEDRVKDLLGTTSLSERRVEVRLLMCPSNNLDPYGPVREVTVRF